MISKEIVRLQAEYSRSPSRARRRRWPSGEREAIQHIRRRFQQQMAESFSSIVEQATGRKVRTFLSETNVEQDVSVETFLLADGRTDMTAFEGE